LFTWSEYIPALLFSLRKFLIKEKKMMFVNVRGEGYRVIHPREQTYAAVEAGWKQVSKGLKFMQQGIEHVNSGMLNREERSYNLSVRAKMAGLKTMLGRKKDLLKLE